MGRFVLVGEGLLELVRDDGAPDQWRLGHGGDVLNTAIHLARLGDDVRYLTALGDDAFSDELRQRWTAEGIDPGLMLTAPGLLPGLYAIRTDADGERWFSYWREQSAARQTFSLPGSAAAVAAAADADLLAFSLISLAILPDDGREALLALAQHIRRAGGQVAFDGNYRPALWPDAGAARRWRDRAIACCSIGLPTLEDEALLGDGDDPAAVAARWQAGGVGEVVVKLGATGCLLSGGGLVAPPERLVPKDTSGAGDAFNAGYLHARRTGASPDAAARAGHRLAGWVVMRRGAVPPRDPAFPDRDQLMAGSVSTASGVAARPSIRAG